MTAPPWTIAEVNGWDRETFVGRLGGVFESSPWIAERAWSQRPFVDVADLHARLSDIVRSAGTDAQFALIRAHPDLVGRAALAGTLTRASTGEQAAAGLDPGSLSATEIERFATLNAGYTSRFGFPFVVCARENTKAAILAGMTARIGNTTDAERLIALDEIVKIAWHRLTDAVQPPSLAETT